MTQNMILKVRIYNDTTNKIYLLAKERRKQRKKNKKTYFIAL